MCSMFKKRWFNVITSDEGFSVKILGRTGVKYTEGSKTMVIDSEVLATKSPTALVLSKNSIRTWDPPHKNELIDDAKRDVIIDNVRRALRFYGWEIDVW